MVPPCAVESPCRAAGFPAIITEEDPLVILSGGPTHKHILPTVAAGSPPINTVGMPGGMMGPPVCGVPGGGGGGLINGQV